MLVLAAIIAMGESDDSSVTLPEPKSVGGVPLPVPKLSGSNLILNASFENGGNSPTNWNQNHWGENKAVFTYPVEGITGSAAKVEMTDYTDGDAKWYFDDVKVIGGESYTFIGSYRSSAPIDLTARYTMTDGSYEYASLLRSGASLDWKENVVTFVVPEEVQSVTIFHVLQEVGELVVDDYKLHRGNAFAYARGKVTFSFDDGWLEHALIAGPVLDSYDIDGTFYVMSKEMDSSGLKKGFFKRGGYGDNAGPYANLEQIKALADSGHEIGSHTRTHLYLTQLSPKEKNTELRGSLRELVEAGFTDVSTIAYPYGDFDDDVKEITAKAGYTVGRSVLRGFNDRATDRYALRIQQVDRETPVEDMMEWIDQAEKDNLWLILMFHQISDDTSDGLGVTEEDFIALIEHSKEADVDIVTVAEGVLMGE